MTDTVLSLRLRASVRASLEKVAAERGMKVSQLAAEILQHGVEQMALGKVQDAVDLLCSEIRATRSERTDDRELMVRMEGKVDTLLATLQKFEGVDV
jgi:predicted DNA-binding ribbon-helix-helix protein